MKFQVLAGKPRDGIQFPDTPVQCPCCGGKLREHKWYCDDGEVEWYECAECSAHFGMSGARVWHVDVDDDGSES